MLLNLSMLASSSGASTSSKIQKGAGLRRYIENSSAVAVNVFSPPESWLIVNGRFPFGLAMISISDSSGLFGLASLMSQSSSSLNNERNTRRKWSRTWLKASIKVWLATPSISLIVLISDSFAFNRSSFCVRMKSLRCLISWYASMAIGLIGPMLSSLSRILLTSWRILSSSASRSAATSSCVVSLNTVSRSTLNSTDNLSFTELSSSLLSLNSFCNCMSRVSIFWRACCTSRNSFSTLSMLPRVS